MNLILRPLDNSSDPVWSVIISLMIFLVGVTYYIVYIMRMAFDELKDDGSPKRHATHSDQPEGCGSGPADSTPGASH